MHAHNTIKTLHAGRPTATYKEQKTNNNKHVICQLYSMQLKKK